MVLFAGAPENASVRDSRQSHPASGVFRKRRAFDCLNTPGGTRTPDQLGSAALTAVGGAAAPTTGVCDRDRSVVDEVDRRCPGAVDHEAAVAFSPFSQVAACPGQNLAARRHTASRGLDGQVSSAVVLAVVGCGVHGERDAGHLEARSRQVDRDRIHTWNGERRHGRTLELR